MKKNSFSVTGILLAYIFLFSGCKSDTEGTSQTRQIHIKVVNLSTEGVTDVWLMFIDKTISKINAGESYRDSYPVETTRADGFRANDHIEYTIKSKRFDARTEQGEFSGRPLFIPFDSEIVVTIYEEYYTLETQPAVL
ncbi:MAG: hypothetical protein LBU18_06795 [Treponema sp.]|jgi:hypothetical protein|nr:hypothetical protein [Treponema sp.]